MDNNIENKSIDDTQDNSNDSDNNNLAGLTHILALFTWIIGPAIVYFVSSDEFVKENALTALNWQISFTIWIIISVILSFVLIGLIGFIIFPLLDTIFTIVAAVKAFEGEVWDYPITLDIV